MPDDMTTALKALLDQVQSLTEKVDAVTSDNTDLKAERDKVAANNAKLTDELKDRQRADAASKMAEDRRLRDLEAANIYQNEDGTFRMGKEQQDVVLSREEARDPQKYREAKTLAEQRGVSVRVESATGDPTRRNVGRPDVIDSKVITFDDTNSGKRWVRADHHKGDGIVGRVQEAERQGFKIRTFRTRDDFDPVARRMFDLREGAANAETS